MKRKCIQCGNEFDETKYNCCYCDECLPKKVYCDNLDNFIYNYVPKNFVKPIGNVRHRLRLSVGQMEIIERFIETGEELNMDNLYCFITLKTSCNLRFVKMIQGEFEAIVEFQKKFGKMEDYKLKI